MDTYGYGYGGLQFDTWYPLSSLELHPNHRGPQNNDKSNYKWYLPYLLIQSCHWADNNQQTWWQWLPCIEIPKWAPKVPKWIDPMLKHGFWRGSLKDSPSENRILRLQVMVSGRLFREDIESTVVVSLFGLNMVWTFWNHPILKMSLYGEYIPKPEVYGQYRFREICQSHSADCKLWGKHIG